VCVYGRLAWRRSRESDSSPRQCTLAWLGPPITNSRPVSVPAGDSAFSASALCPVLGAVEGISSESPRPLQPPASAARTMSGIRTGFIGLLRGW
jgi:hypothetical protein